MPYVGFTQTRSDEFLNYDLLRHKRSKEHRSIMSNAKTQKPEYTKYWDARTLDPADLIVKVDRMKDIGARQVDAIHELFNKYGVAIVQHAPAPEPVEEMVTLGTYFGNPVKHDRADKRGLVVIAELDAHKEFVGASSGPHLMHTGGTFMEWQDVPKVVLLQCEIQSRVGGQSMVAPGAAAFRYFQEHDPEGLAMLMDPQIFSIQRTFDGRGEFGKTGVSGKAVFDTKRLESGRIWLTFRFDGSIKLDLRPDAAHEVYDRLVRFFDRSENQISFKLQPNQILVCDNTSVVHSRTAYQAGSKRKLNRLQCDGARDGLVFGFPRPESVRRPADVMPASADASNRAESGPRQFA
jgi:alpha-ketoglutarate-dependent taurine dioxygenase